MISFYAVNKITNSFLSLSSSSKRFLSWLAPLICCIWHILICFSQQKELLSSINNLQLMIKVTMCHGLRLGYLTAVPLHFTWSGSFWIILTREGEKLEKMDCKCNVKLLFAGEENCRFTSSWQFSTVWWRVVSVLVWGL